MKKYQILLSYDDPKLRQLMSWALAEQGYEVTVASAMNEAMEALDKGNFDVVLAGLEQNSRNDITVLKKAKQQNPLTMVILLGCKESSHYNIEDLPQEADEFIMHPCGVPEMWKRVANCLARLELKKRDARCVIARRRLALMAQDMKRMGDGAYGALDHSVTVKMNQLLETVYELIGDMNTVLEDTASLNYDESRV